MCKKINHKICQTKLKHLQKYETKRKKTKKQKQKKKVCNENREPIKTHKKTKGKICREFQNKKKTENGKKQ